MVYTWYRLCLNLLSLTLSSTAGSDYNDPVVTTVTFGSGQTSASYPVPILDDTNIENTEIFTATLSTTESGVNIGDDTATVTILDDDSELQCTCSYYIHVFVACNEEY